MKFRMLLERMSGWEDGGRRLPLTEAFFDHMVIQGPESPTGRREVVPLFVNPSRKELAECGPEWRGVVLPDGNLYAAPEPYIHERIVRELELHGKVGKSDFFRMMDSPSMGVLVHARDGKVYVGESNVYAHHRTPEDDRTVEATFAKAREKNPGIEFVNVAVNAPAGPDEGNSAKK